MEVFMNKTSTLHENMDMPDPDFPVKLHDLMFFKKGEEAFPVHWHEENEFIYISTGSAAFECNLKPMIVNAGDLIVMNSNDLHRGVSLSDDLSYYCIIMDTAILHSRTMDICETKYLMPIDQNRIIFENLVNRDEEVIFCINRFIEEYKKRDVGYELELKACLYRLLVILLRRHVEKVLTTNESNTRIKNLERFNPILKYIEIHYNEELTLDMLCSMGNMSRFHFCRQFKELTGKTLNEYINFIRIDKSLDLIKNSELTITEIALSSGFNDINYFSRVFKRYYKLSPSRLREKIFN
jgi:AraC-like DNA-binding protein/mannose-6-phosphate isomerase-like protein (cupin superfamily)